MGFGVVVDFIRKKPFHLLSILSALIIAAVYFIEYVLGHPPCILCLYQRLPWYGLLIIALLGWQWQNRHHAINRTFIAVALLVTLGSMVLSGYHVGVEWTWWAGPNSCGGAIEAVTAEELLTTQPIRCDIVNFRLLGGSLALWNFAASTLLLLGGMVWWKNNG